MYWLGSPVKNCQHKESLPMQERLARKSWLYAHTKCRLRAGSRSGTHPYVLLQPEDKQ